MLPEKQIKIFKWPYTGAARRSAAQSGIHPAADEHYLSAAAFQHGAFPLYTPDDREAREKGKSALCVRCPGRLYTDSGHYTDRCSAGRGSLDAAVLCGTGSYPVFCDRREAVVQLQPGRAGALVQQRVDTACRRKGEGTAQKELKNLSDETGMFGSITDEQIQAEISIMWGGLVRWAGPAAEGIRQANRENYESLWADNT